MNVFYTDPDPRLAAQYACDAHVVKMPTECVQMLVAALKRHNIDTSSVLTKAGNPHKGGHPNHPCTKWAGDSWANWAWLFCHGGWLVREHGIRYGGLHTALSQLQVLGGLVTPRDIVSYHTPPPQCMPDECKHEDTVVAYRQLIAHKVREKPDRFKWAKLNNEPEWLAEYL